MIETACVLIVLNRLLKYIKINGTLFSENVIALDISDFDDYY